MLEEREGAITDQVHGRLVTSDQEQDQCRDQLLLVDLALGGLGRDHGGDKVIPRVLPACVHDPAKVT